MKNDFIFLTGGDAPDLGSFSRGEVRKIEADKVGNHIKRKTLIAVDDLSKDVLIYWLVSRGIDPPDKSNKADLRKILIYGEESLKEVEKEEEVTEDE